MGAFRYDLAVDLDEAVLRRELSAVLVDNGFRVDTRADGGIRAKRGNAAATLVLGLLAKEYFPLTVTLRIEAAPSQAVVHVARNPASGIAGGLSLGLARADGMFETLRHEFVERFTALGAEVGIRVLG